MKKQIMLQNRNISYTLHKSKRARRMRLAVYGGGNIVVTLPRGVSENVVERFLEDKARWLLLKLELFSQVPRRNTSEENNGDYETHKQEALALVTSRVAYFSGVYSVACNAIRIKKQKTCWGSCSKKRNLNFNYKILFLPPRVRDYVIIHELCHLKEFNHSRAFWNLVKQAAPDYAEVRKKLYNAQYRLSFL